MAEAQSVVFLQIQLRRLGGKEVPKQAEDYTDLGALSQPLVEQSTQEDMQVRIN